jgi:hypothetical protein
MTIPPNVHVKKATYIGDYRIGFAFTDGHTSELDLHAFLTKPAQHPGIARYLDVTLFRKFRVDQRADLVWGDWDMCFPFASLYAGDVTVDSLGDRKRAASPRKRATARATVSRTAVSRSPRVRKAH